MTKKNKIISIAIILFQLSLVAFFATACTQQQRAKEWGGTVNISLESNSKLVNATWKESHLWLLTRKVTEADKAETFVFEEKSTWGVLQGKVIIVETKR
jgi:hypothetical protein